MERLRGIQNDAVNQHAQDTVLGKMAEEAELWRYMLAALPDPDARTSSTS